jgi:hypothetical protein
MKLQTSDVETFEVESEGMMESGGQWIPIDCQVSVEKETEKAYYGEVTVFECDDFGRNDVIYEKNTWLPKSMSQNPWWIVTKLFDFSGKVSNRRFDEYD